MQKIIYFSSVIFLLGCSAIKTIDARIDIDESGKTQSSAALNQIANQLHINNISEKQWHHGALDCQADVAPAIEVFRYDQTSYILRQNKCQSFEAPFIYLLFGEEKILVLDTGASKKAIDFPLYQTVQSLISQQTDVKKVREILVLHSHSHSDHTAADEQFVGKANVRVINPNETALMALIEENTHFENEISIELGGRKLIIIPTPGHQEEAISIYDTKTKWLLTGDSLYPGYIYIKDWQAYKNSIAKLSNFAQQHEISAILGAHIEMTTSAGEYYDIGTRYQPNEAALTLLPQDMMALNIQLQQNQSETKIVFNKFIIAPMSIFQKTLSNVARKIAQ